MDHIPTNDMDRRSLPTILREVSAGIQDVFRSEFRMAKAEFRTTASRVTRDSALFGIFGAFAALGIFPFMAFLVIGLGKLIGDRYWLSSLIVALAMFIIGGIMAYASFQKVRSEDLTLSTTREALDQPFDAVDRRLHQVADITSGRRSA